MMPAKSGREVIPAKGSLESLFFLSKSRKQDRRRSGQFRACRKAHDADLVRVDSPFLGVSAYHADGLKRVVDFIGLRVITVAPQSIPQDDGVDAVVIEERNEIGRLAADVQSIVPAARRQNHRRPGIEAAIDRVYFNRRVVNVDDAVDPPRHGLAHVVLLGLADAVHFEVRRAGRIKSDYHAALQDRQGSIRSIGRRPRLGNSQRCRQRRQRRPRSILCISRSHRQSEYQPDLPHSSLNHNRSCPTLVWGTVENLAPTSRDLAAGRCINILSGEVRPGEVFIIFGGPQGHADRLATCGRLAIGLPEAPIAPEEAPHVAFRIPHARSPAPHRLPKPQHPIPARDARQNLPAICHRQRMQTIRFHRSQHLSGLPVQFHDPPR